MTVYVEIKNNTDKVIAEGHSVKDVETQLNKLLCPACKDDHMLTIHEIGETLCAYENEWRLVLSDV